jgi:hypothetical protein
MMHVVVAVVIQIDGAGSLNPSSSRALLMSGRRPLSTGRRRALQIKIRPTLRILARAIQVLTKEKPPEGGSQIQNDHRERIEA